MPVQVFVGVDSGMVAPRYMLARAASASSGTVGMRYNAYGVHAEISYSRTLHSPSVGSSDLCFTLNINAHEFFPQKIVDLYNAKPKK